MHSDMTEILTKAEFNAATQLARKRRSGTVSCDSGRARFEARSVRDTQILGRAETVKANYRRRYDAHSEAVGQLARRLGWSFLRHRTDHSPLRNA